MINKKNKTFLHIKKFLQTHASEIYYLAQQKHIKHLGEKNIRISYLKHAKLDHINLVKQIANHLCDTKKGVPIVEKHATALAKKSVKYNVSLEVIVDDIIFIKQSLWEKLYESGWLETLSPQDFYVCNQIITSYLDITASKIAFAYNTFYNQVDIIQKRLASIVESSDDAILSISIDGFISSWNKGAEHLYGYTEDEIMGKPVSVLMPPEKRDDFPKIMKGLQNGRKFEHYETKRMTKCGNILDVSLTVSPIKNSEGEIIGTSKVARDITDRKQSETRQTFLNNASKILVTSINYEITLKNLSKLIVPYFADYCRIVIVDEKKNIQEISLNHKNPKEIPLVRRLYDAYKNHSQIGVGKLISSGKPEIMSRVQPDSLQYSDKKVINLIKKLGLKSYMGVPMKIGNKIVGAITFSSVRNDRLYTKDDLVLATELARRSAVALENARLYDDSQKAIKLRDEFISVASHELKTPVTSLKMYVQILKKKHQQMGFDTRSLDKMDSQVNKLTLLIQDLLNVSRLQTGRLEFHDDFFDIREVIDEVIELVQPTTSNHMILVKGSLKKPVWGDRERIGQVITNLLTNAIKYSPKADKILITLTKNDHIVSVTIKDFGIGIDKKHLSKIFERFYRVSDTTENTFPGLGLGLYISNEIIKRYRSQIKVQSVKEKGSEFTFSLQYNSSSS